MSQYFKKFLNSFGQAIHPIGIGRSSQIFPPLEPYVQLSSHTAHAIILVKNYYPSIWRVVSYVLAKKWKTLYNYIIFPFNIAITIFSWKFFNNRFFFNKNKNLAIVKTRYSFIRRLDLYYLVSLTTMNRLKLWLNEILCQFTYNYDDHNYLSLHPLGLNQMILSDLLPICFRFLDSSSTLSSL